MFSVQPSPLPLVQLFLSLLFSLDVDQISNLDFVAPVLKGRPRKKKIRNSTLAKELKRKRFLADLERVKKNLPSKNIKLSESEEGTESDLSEESTKSYESMDEDKAHYTIETPISMKRQPNGLLPVSIKQVVKVTTLFLLLLSYFHLRLK
jgi:hypothetical protein